MVTSSHGLGTAVLPSSMPRLGVHLHHDGVQVGVMAAHATSVDFCLIDIVDVSRDVRDPQRYRERRFPLTGPVWGAWHGFIPGVGEGQRYGFRVHGRWDPMQGLRHNPAKLLFDPYARGVVGSCDYSGACFGHQVEVPALGHAVGDPYGALDSRDSLPHVPHAVVVGHRTDLPIRRPQVPWSDVVVYEAHVRGLTQRDEQVPEHLRGTYAGLAHPATITRLQSLGVTTIELLPIHAMLSEPHLLAKGLTNYWGYSTLGFFAPNPQYATREAQAAGPGAVLDEVRGMVHLLHEAGLEVVLDVVYNHTCEGGLDGMHLAWRGLDNPGYYLHDGGIPARYADVTGCGNSLDFRRPQVIEMAVDSLRYWAGEIGVDGFRYDLAVTCARDGDGFDATHPFLVALRTDPVLRQVKHIAEPWDVGPGGWRTGQFPVPMTEWNDAFRDAARQFWLADLRDISTGLPGHGVRDLATRLAGSADIFGPSDPPLMRGPAASVNFVTAHDGFTMADLTAFHTKHNGANGEEGRDGTDNNRSWNHGVEGWLDSIDPDAGQWNGPEWTGVRARSMRNLFATLLLAAGTPMITAGDEWGRSQHGNNNAYAQDNEVSWLSWRWEPWQHDLRDTVAFLVGLRRRFPALRSSSFLSGRPPASGLPVDLAWFRSDGAPMTPDDWHRPECRTLQMFRGRPASDAADVLVVINGSLDEVAVTLSTGNGPWLKVWDSVWQRPIDDAVAVSQAPGNRVISTACSMQVYVCEYGH